MAGLPQARQRFGSWDDKRIHAFLKVAAAIASAGQVFAIWHVCTGKRLNGGWRGAQFCNLPLRITMPSSTYLLPWCWLGL